MYSRLIKPLILHTTWIVCSLDNVATPSLKESTTVKAVGRELMHSNAVERPNIERKSQLLFMLTNKFYYMVVLLFVT